MRNLIVLFLAISPAFASAQYIDTIMPYKDGRIHYEEVKEVKGMPKGTIYSLSKQWLVKTFNGSPLIISEDFETGQIISKGLVRAEGTKVTFLIQIDSKDDKYRFRVNNVNNIVSNSMLGEREYPLEGKMLDKMNDKQKGLLDRTVKSVDSQIKAIIKNFNTSIKESREDQF